MANLFSFRVDEVEGVTRESIKNFVTKNSEKHVVCYEISDITKKPHYQGWVRTSLSQQVFRNRIKLQWPSVCGTVKGRSNGKYSTAPVKKENEYQAYIFKGTKTSLPDVVSMQLSIGESIDVEKIYREYWRRNEELRDGRGAVQHIVDMAIEHFKNFVWGTQDFFLKRKIISEYMLQQLSESKSRTLGVHIFRGYLNRICLSVAGDEWRQEFLSDVLSRF